MGCANYKIISFKELIREPLRQGMPLYDYLNKRKTPPHANLAQDMIDNTQHLSRLTFGSVLQFHAQSPKESYWVQIKQKTQQNECRGGGFHWFGQTEQVLLPSDS